MAGSHLEGSGPESLETLGNSGAMQKVYKKPKPKTLSPGPPGRFSGFLYGLEKNHQTRPRNSEAAVVKAAMADWPA